MARDAGAPRGEKAGRLNAEKERLAVTLGQHDEADLRPRHGRHDRAVQRAGQEHHDRMGGQRGGWRASSPSVSNVDRARDTRATTRWRTDGLAESGTAGRCTPCWWRRHLHRAGAFEERRRTLREDSRPLDRSRAGVPGHHQRAQRSRGRSGRARTEVGARLLARGIGQRLKSVLDDDCRQRRHGKKALMRERAGEAGAPRG